MLGSSRASNPEPRRRSNDFDRPDSKQIFPRGELSEQQASFVATNHRKQSYNASTPESGAPPDNPDVDAKNGEISRYEGAPTSATETSSTPPHVLPSEGPRKDHVRTLTQKEYEVWALENIREGMNTKMP
jgi:hypothetical protein